MKIKLTIFICFSLLCSSIYGQVYRLIPDPNFRAFLVSKGMPFDGSGQYLDISSGLVTSESLLLCYSRSISNLEGVQYFTSLAILDCNSNNLDSLPVLPESLRSLICHTNHLISLPALPDSLTLLHCEDNLIDSLPTLPSKLNTLRVSGNNLIHLPPLPNFLQTLTCSSNHLTNLPDFPETLTELSCSGNNLISLPNLPRQLSYLECSYNNLLSLPGLPNTLSTLYCSHNFNLNCLPFLPPLLTIIRYDSTSVECIPNIVIGGGYYPSLGTHPICDPVINSCPGYNVYSGYTYFDVNHNCHINSSEPVIQNINLILSQDSIRTGTTSSLRNGNYGFDKVPDNIYTIHVDTTEMPFSIFCPSSGIDTIVIDSANWYYTNVNFGFQCKSGFDIGTIGLVNTSRIRAANIVPFNLHAGDFAKLYNIGCAFVAGKIVLNYSGPLTYSGVSAGTFEPDTILPNRLVWNITNFAQISFFDTIKPEFFIDSNAIIGDLVCFTTEVTPTLGDRIPSNNIFSQCYIVKGAFDPNIKEVAPHGSVKSSQGWLYYTVQFQNTGNDYAENIYVWDTIDGNLDLSTIQVMGSSHDQYMHVFPNTRSVRFNFLNINLVDSATNEQASHAYVQYRIKLKDGLSNGIIIKNNASIFFDLNSPVNTNTTFTTICNSPSLIYQNFTITKEQTIHVGLHNYSKAGTYTDILINIFGCDSVVITTLTVPSGLEDISKNKILFYPNPANTEVIIRLEGVNKLPMMIYDIYGRKVFETESISDKYLVDTRSLIEGTYIIRCGMMHEKLMVQH